MNSTKKTFLTSLMALLLCVVMLMGTTFAWFTDVVTSTGNIIQAGNLDAEMYYSESLDEPNWKNADGPAVFNYDKWEPGYTSVRYIKVKNAGKLNFKFQLSLDANGVVSKLGDVIDVYFFNPATEEITTLDGLTKVDNLTNVIKNHNNMPGTLAPGAEVILAIALHMQESAGNEYQKLELCEGGFDLKLIATQVGVESDSFGPDYDDGATWEDNLPEQSTASSKMELNEDGTLPIDLTFANDDGTISITVPAGTKFKQGTKLANLNVNKLATSGANITLEENEETRSFDVHVANLDESNTKVISIAIKEFLPVGLNMGNYQLYHVEDGQTVEMKLLADGETPVHNCFNYDPATGDVVLHLASFSEVALVADTENAWEGKFDYTWYTNAVAPIDGETVTEYIIANADQLAAFGAIVGGMNGQTKDSFEGKTVKLISDINLGYGVENHTYHMFYPIGYYNSTGSYKKESGGSVTSNVSSFKGTFDGNGNTIANFYQNTWEMFGDYNDGYSGTPNHYKDAMGLFGYVYGGTVKNLTVDNFSSDGEFTPTGVIAAYAAGNAVFENIAITKCNPRVYNTGNGGIIGIAGRENEAVEAITLKNITVDNSNKISALWGSWDVACGGLVGMYRGNVDGNGNATGDTISFENCHVAAQIDVYNDVCANYQYYAYRYSGMIIGSVRHNTKNAEGKTIPNMAGISASGCTVNYGDWNDYYYCEFEKNSMASYSKDYQFSRVPHSELNFTDSNGNGVVDADERASVTGCKHTHTAEENHRAVYLPFHQLFTGYSWGVSSIGLKEYSGIVTNLDITEGEQQESVKKFESKFTGDFLYRVGNQNTVSIGSLFGAVPKLDENGEKQYDENGKLICWDIKDAGVWVKVEKLDEKMNVGGTFTANTTDWTKGTIQFSGTGVVKVTIQDYNFCTPTELILEVVNAKNTTTASFSGNTVLLNNVDSSVALSTSHVIYGNGFTINIENAPITHKYGAVIQLYDGAILKNVSIVGKEFTTVAQNVNDTNYGVAAVRAWGTVVIENSYISGCRSAVYATGTQLTIKDSVIANGIYANIDLAAGTLNLHNVTTINEPHDVNGTTVVGLGIVGNLTASAGRQINITGTLTQYNWVSKADCANIKASGVDSILNSVFTDSKYSSLRYTYNGTTYVNTGILSLCSDFGASSLTGKPSNYDGMDVTATIGNITSKGYVWAPAQAGALIDADMKYHNALYTWTPTSQGTSYIPSTFNYNNAGLTEEEGVVQIEYESGSSYTLSADTIKALFSASKYGQPLSYKVTLNGADYTGKDIVFDDTASQTYTIIYTITDNIVYDKNGKVTDTTYEVTKELKVFATVVDKGADAPNFTFYYGTNGSASAGKPHVTQPTNSYTSTIKQVGDVYYIMPNVTATSANAIGSKTVDGTTVYYPIVDGINVRSGTSSDYDFTRYYPIFKAVKISDNGTEYSYAGTKEMPATVAWVSAEIDSGNGASSLNDGFGLYNNQHLCKIQKKAGNAEAGGTSVVKFSYTALDGNTYYYYVGYRFYDEDEGCLVEGTLITMADGTQKPVEDLKVGDMIMVFNHVTGKYEAMPLIFNTHADEVEAKDYDVLYLQFANGKEVKIVQSHGFFDTTLMKYVYIDYDNYKDFIGHEFYAMTEDGTGERVELTNAFIQNERVRIFCPVTYFHMNSFANGFLNTPNIPGDITGLVNYFEYDADLKYNEEAMQRDIEKYGLYTYDDFSEYISEEAYNSSPSVYLKVAVGKGMITYEQIIDVIKYLLAGSLIDN